MSWNDSKEPFQRLGNVWEETERELLKIAARINVEEMVTVAEAGTGDKDNEENDDIEGWVDEMALLSEEERVALHGNVGPVCLSS